MAPEDAVQYIHGVMQVLAPTFDVPYTTEGIASLAHVRTAVEFDQVLAWLAHANQFALCHKPGWSTPPESSAAAAAAAWNAVRSCRVVFEGQGLGWWD